MDLSEDKFRESLKKLNVDAKSSDISRYLKEKVCWFSTHMLGEFQNLFFAFTGIYAPTGGWSDCFIKQIAVARSTTCIYSKSLLLINFTSDRQQAARN